jgi:hypothetical protein
MLTRLTSERFEAARSFIHAEASPLDLALWRMAFEDGDGGAVLAALSSFQNPDGGFGRGLEPDLSTAASSAIATSIGLRHMRSARAPTNHPMVGSVLSWLMANVVDGVWPIIDSNVDEGPHAPWWVYDDDLAARWLGFRFNPTAEILAHLYVFRMAAPPGLVEAAEARMRLSIRETGIITGPYDLRCAAILADTLEAPTDLRKELSDLLMRSVSAHSPEDEHAPVLDLAPKPTSLLAGALADRIEHASATLIASQQGDGGWTPFWNWISVDEAAWLKAEKTWRGTLTRQALEALMAHGRVEQPQTR